MIKYFFISVWGAGALMFLLIAILTLLVGEKETYKDHEMLLKHVNALLVCMGFMLVGIGLMVVSR